MLNLAPPASKKTLDAKMKAQMKLKVGQEYFTPYNIAEDLINYSGIHDDPIKHMKILEPTAGYGNIIRVLLKLMSKKRKTFSIDMVEISQENRQHLQQYADTIPYILNLMKTTDFLEFIPSEKYDYIFMNPPFHLDKRLNKKYLKDYYDYDFVKRAYACLDIGGILCAITGQSYLKNKDMVKWYKSHKAEIELKTVKWSGEGLKEGGEIQKLDIAFIRIKKFDKGLLTEKEDQELLKIDKFVETPDVVSMKNNFQFKEPSDNYTTKHKKTEDQKQQEEAIKRNKILRDDISNTQDNLKKLINLITWHNYSICY